MSLIVTNESKVLMLGLILNKVTADGSSPNSDGNRKLKLFVNNIVPSATTGVANLTECISAGYSALTLVGSNWTIATEDGVTSATYVEQVFDIDEEVLIYGYYVTSLDGTELLWVERFDGAPYALPTGGGSIGVSLNFTLT